MEPNKVVIKFKDGRLSKGKTSDFFPNKTKFHLEATDGQIEEVDIEELKAVFFVKDLGGNKNHEDSYMDKIAGGGRKIKVDFLDDETVIGYTLGYSPERQGFYMTPADLKGNNERIFVVKSATRGIEFI